MVLDILLFREEKGGNPNLLRESQRRRCKDPGAVDTVIGHDQRWRELLLRVENMKKIRGFCSKCVGEKKKAKEPDGDDVPVPDEFIRDLAELTKDRLMALNVTQLKGLSQRIADTIVEDEQAQEQAIQDRQTALALVGNVVHESCRPTDDEDHNEVVRKWDPPEGTRPPAPAEVWNHVDLMSLLGMDCSERATRISGGRAFYLKGELVQLQLALVNFAMSFLMGREYTPMYVPFFMNKAVMGEVAELADFDEALYHVEGDGDGKYLIATSEQPICAYHRNQWFQEKELEKPIKYAGFSTCFRKEAGAHGRDTLGIFRVHQFEKVEQFVVCSPRDGASWKCLDEMIGTSQAFYEALGLPYRTVCIVAGALNLAAAKKFDLEALFPASDTYRELVSCSNCTDYQSRAINCRFGQSNKGTARENVKEHPHMLNGTLCAVTRTMCCIVENYQTEEGIVVPAVLRPFMGGKELLRFQGPKVRAAPASGSPKKGGAKQGGGGKQAAQHKDPQ
eukprot:TRINITY_DN5185_c0_g1_i1.p1 TRINITY_DN5185_c0_g1~~TRINITY_DN5185_c0_g1_i1.p1  ORF type:complete len:542 (+),score=253.10 TRINITY_DN5185_c0_g1_i1:110-1627(+)